MIKWIIDSLENDKSPILDSRVYSDLVTVKNIVDRCNSKSGKVIFVGNEESTSGGFLISKSLFQIENYSWIYS